MAITNSQDSDIDEDGYSRRNAYLSPFAVIALSFGYAVGWGAFVLPGTMFLPNAGPAGSIIGFLIGTLIVVVLAFNYHKMTSFIRGGSYRFVSQTFGYNHGFLVGWFLFLTYLAIFWANATALVLLARYLFGDAFQFGFYYKVIGFDVYFGEVLLCLAAIVLCAGACLLSKRFAIRLHMFFAFVLIAGVTACFIAAVCRHTGGMAAMAPAFAADSPVSVQFLRILAMVPWAFVGFEAVVQSSSEFAFPVKRTFSLLFVAIVISALAYIFLMLLPVLAFPDGYSNWKEYIDALPRLKGIAAIPVFSAARKVLGPWGIAVIGGSMLAGQLTALFATYIALSRLMRAMADDKMIPEWFARSNREGNPVNAIVTVMCLSIPIPFLGRTVTGWSVDLSNLGAAIAYVYISAASYTHLRKDPAGGHFIGKAAGFFGIVMSAAFCLLTLVPNYLSGSSLSTESYLFLALWCFIGFLVYRRVFVMDTTDRLGRSTIVWIAELIGIFFSSLMWFRLTVCDSAEYSFGELVGKTVTENIAMNSISYINTDMLLKSSVVLFVLVASLAIILNLLSIHHSREKDLIVEKLKAEESVSRQKSYFFSTISHDIRTPLNAIIGYSQMLKMGFKTEEEREQALNSVIGGSRSLLRLVNDMIDFARLEDGRLEFVTKPTDCNALLHDFVDFFCKAKQIQAIELRSRAEGIPTVLIDPKRVRQILFSLVDNAAKFTRKGFVEVRASFDCTAESDTGTLRFEVEDTGIGISDEDLKRIASPYVQVDSKHSRHGGTGIGLALCRKLANAMNGELTVVSAIGKGSTFTVTLRCVKVTDAAPVEDHDPLLELLVVDQSSAPSTTQDEAPAVPEVKEKIPAEAVAARRILIADDQKMNLIVLKTMLKKLGAFDIVMAKDGKEALDILTAPDQSFDLVLTDMWMPVMDGEGLVRAVRADGRLAALPVHVVTADTEMPGKYKELGFDGILLKPVTVEKLKELIG